MTERLNCIEHRGLLANSDVRSTTLSPCPQGGSGWGIPIAPQMSSRVGQMVSLCGSLWFPWLLGLQDKHSSSKALPQAPSCSASQKETGSGPYALQPEGPQAGPQGRRTACFQPPAGVGGQPQGDQGPRSPRTRASGLPPARGLEPGLHKEVLSWPDSGMGREPEATVPDHVAITEPGLRDRRVDRASPDAWVSSRTCVPGSVLHAPAFSAFRRRPGGQVSACSLPEQDPRAMACIKLLVVSPDSTKENGCFLRSASCCPTVPSTRAAMSVVEQSV